MAAVMAVFASKLVGIIVGMAKEELEMLLGVPGEITKLEATLGDLSSILADADRKRIGSHAVERWVRELKDAMYDIDDILDLCQIMEGGEDPTATAAAAAAALRTTGGSCWNMPMLFCFRNPKAAHEIGRKIQALNKRLLDIAERSSRFRFIIQQINSSSHSSSAANPLSYSNRKTGPVIVRSEIVGESVERDTKKIVDLLVKNVDDDPLGSNTAGNVVVAAAITGAGGIGKTTLARMVFNDSMVEENFDKRIWLSVTKEVVHVSILQSVVAGFGSNCDGSNRDVASLENALKGAVRRTKFLLVMDDVWSEKVWSEILRVPLTLNDGDGAPGSRVLVTTRDEEVARKMRTHLHRVDKLEGEDAWILLKNQVVYNKSDEQEVDGLKDIGMKIVERCDGLPLAIKLLGGALARYRTKDAWANICNHFAWSIERMDEDIDKAVYLSYEELRPELKQCFISCSLFPKHELIRAGDIVQLWIAQGYVADKMSWELPEDKGLEYYRELVSRNLLEPNKGSYDHSACTMHDVIRSFAQYITKDEGILVSEGHNVNITLSNSKLRHLSISNKAEVQWDALQKQVSLRTLILSGSTTVEPKDLWDSLPCLRVLYLNDVNLVEVPESICHLKHLRFLSLSSTNISTIPQAIGDLKFLQGLELVGCKNISQLPNSILKLRKLRLLNIRSTKITSVPRGLGKLQDLVILTGFAIHSSNDHTEDWCSLEELGSLSKIKILDIIGLEKVSSGSMAARANLSGKHHLTELNLKFTSRLKENGESEDNISMDEHEQIKEVLGNLCPPTCIQELVIRGYFGSGLPHWARTMSAFRSLRRLFLEGYACCKQLPNGLGQLPNLDYFWVEGAPSILYIGHDLLFPTLGGKGDGKDDDTPAITGTAINSRSQSDFISHAASVAFPKLKTLGFEGMLGWREWGWEQQIPAMTVLEALLIDNCKLQRLPPGLARHAVRLMHLDLRNVMHLVSIENILSLVELKTIDNPRLEKISNCPSLQKIFIFSCPRLKLLEDLPSLRSADWKDLDAETLPQYLREANKLSKMIMYCSLRLLRLISLQDDTSEWGKIRHIQKLKAYACKSESPDIDGYIYYTKDPYSYEAVMRQPTEEPSTGKQLDQDKVVAIYQTPCSVHCKIRLARSTIRDHYMLRYIKTIDMLIDKLSEDDGDDIDNQPLRCTEPKNQGKRLIGIVETVHEFMR